MPRRHLDAVLVAVAALGVSPRARADTQACFDAALLGQKLEREEHLLAAREAFVTCGQASCPDAVAQQCAAWLLGVGDALPSVILEAHDDLGRELSDVSVTIDDGGSPLAIDASRDLPLDPGRHVVHWRRANGEVQESTVLLREREKGKRILATFASPPAPRGRPILVYALAGTTAVAAGVFGVFAIKGYADRQSFGCDVSCMSSQGSQVRREFVTADVALGVAAVSLAGTLWLLLRQPQPKEAPARVGAVWSLSTSGASVAW